MNKVVLHLKRNCIDGGTDGGTVGGTKTGDVHPLTALKMQYNAHFLMIDPPLIPLKYKI